MKKFLLVLGIVVISLACILDLILKNRIRLNSNKLGLCKYHRI